MPLVRVKRHFQVTVPADLRDQLHLAEGDILEATVRNNELILKPKTVVDRDVEGLTEGLRDFQEGRVVGPFGNSGELKAALKSPGGSS